jgi:hypothetical protein
MLASLAKDASGSPEHQMILAPFSDLKKLNVKIPFIAHSTTKTMYFKSILVLLTIKQPSSFIHWMPKAVYNKRSFVEPLLFEPDDALSRIPPPLYFPTISCCPVCFRQHNPNCELKLLGLCPQLHNNGTTVEQKPVEPLPVEPMPVEPTPV